VGESLGVKKKFHLTPPDFGQNVKIFVFSLERKKKNNDG